MEALEPHTVKNLDKLFIAKQRLALAKVNFWDWYLQGKDQDKDWQFSKELIEARQEVQNLIHLIKLDFILMESAVVFHGNCFIRIK